MSPKRSMLRFLYLFAYIPSSTIQAKMQIKRKNPFRYDTYTVEDNIQKLKSGKNVLSFGLTLSQYKRHKALRRLALLHSVFLLYFRIL